jgi:glutaredoxin
MAALCTQDNIGNRMKAIVWSKYNCPYCDQAKALLTQRNIAYEERKIGDGYTREDLLESVPNARTVPQIFINNQLVGGFTELKIYLEQTAGGFGKGQI